MSLTPLSDIPRLGTSIAILGCGDVGSTLAYTLLQNPICSEVIMVDPKRELLQAQVRDLSDATYGGRAATKVRAGTHKEAGQADIVVVTAGAKQKTGMSLLSFSFLEDIVLEKQKWRKRQSRLMWSFRKP